MNRLFLVFLVFFCGLSAQAQLRVGPMGGVELAKFVYAPSDTQAYYATRWQPGILGGMVVNYKVDHRYSLHTELLMAYRQRSVTYTNKLLEVKNISRNLFLEVPTLLRVSFPVELDKQDLEFYVNGGPSIAYWLWGNGKLEANRSAILPGGKEMKYRLAFSGDREDGDLYETYDKGYVDLEDRFVWAFQLGGGAIFDFGYGHGIMFDLRTTFGLGTSYLGNEVDFNSPAYVDNLGGNFRTFRLTASYIKDIDVRALLKKGKRR